MNKLSIPFLAAALLLGFAAQGRAVSDPAQMQTDAYVQLVQGDQSLEAGRLDEALGQYQAARRLYEDLASAFPSWEPRIIRYRAAYCDNQIAEINRRIGERVAAYSAQTAATAPAAYYGDASAYSSPYAPVPAPSPAPGIPDSLYQTALRRADSLQAQLDSARNAEQQARAELARIRADLDRANRALSQRSVEADSELARLRDLQGRQQNELQLLRGENARLKAQLEAKAGLDGALNDMESRLNDLNARNRSLEEQVQTLQNALDDFEERAAEDASRRKLAEAASAIETRSAELEAAIMEADAVPDGAAPAFDPAAFDPAAIDWPADDDGTGDTDDDDGYDDIPEVDDDSYAPSIPEPEPEPAPAPAPAPEPAAAAASPAARPAPIRATFPPRPIPPGVAPADFIRLLLNNNEDEAAFATVQKAREDAPGDANLATLEGITLIRLQHYAAAADLLHALSVEHPDDATIHANLGAAWLGEGFYAGAREALRNAIELNPGIGGEYYYNLALVCALTEPLDLDTARDCYRKALDAGIPADPQLDAIMP
jgi:hypothetical protein